MIVTQRERERERRKEGRKKGREETRPFPQNSVPPYLLYSSSPAIHFILLLRSDSKEVVSRRLTFDYVEIDLSR